MCCMYGQNSEKSWEFGKLRGKCLLFSDVFVLFFFKIMNDMALSAKYKVRWEQSPGNQVVILKKKKKKSRKDLSCKYFYEKFLIKDQVKF